MMDLNTGTRDYISNNTSEGEISRYSDFIHCYSSVALHIFAISNFKLF
jgi:hypothetical protein